MSILLKSNPTLHTLFILYIYNRYWIKNRWDVVPRNDSVAVNPLDGEIYAQLINLSSSYEVYFHGSLEIPDISKQRYSFGANDYTTIELLALEIITSENAKSYAI